MSRRAEIARLSPFIGVVSRGEPSPHFQPDFMDDNELYEKFGGLNDIQIAQEHAQYKDLLQFRQQVNTPPPSLFDGCDDSTIMDNICPKYVSSNDLYHQAHIYQDAFKDEIAKQKTQDYG